MAKQRANARTPNTVNFTVARRYLTEREVERMMNTARKHSRHGHRDSTMRPRKARRQCILSVVTRSALCAACGSRNITSNDAALLIVLEHKPLSVVTYLAEHLDKLVVRRNRFGNAHIVRLTEADRLQQLLIVLEHNEPYESSGARTPQMPMYSSPSAAGP
jgi:RNA polymerase subunit RPABC4/transcription elongation factor Spt4